MSYHQNATSILVVDETLVMKDLLFLLLSLMVFQSSHGHYYNKHFLINPQQPPNLRKTLQLDNQEDKLASAAMPALMIGLLALAFSSLLAGSLQVDATAKQSDSFPLLWALPIEYEGQARNDQRKLRKKSVRRRVPKARSALPLGSSSG